MSKEYNYGTGRRKSSVARVYMKSGSGKIVINKRDIDNYLGNHEVAKMIIRQPLVLLELDGKYDLKVNVDGGGITGQSGAIRLGIARALVDIMKSNIKILNVSSAKEYKISDLLKIITNYIVFKNKVNWLDKYDTVTRRHLNTEILEKKIKFREKYTLDHGISETINWFLKNYNQLRK